jgi:hypothetical protein
VETRLQIDQSLAASLHAVFAAFLLQRDAMMNLPIYLAQRKIDFQGFASTDFLIPKACYFSNSFSFAFIWLISPAGLKLQTYIVPLFQSHADWPFRT